MIELIEMIHNGKIKELLGPFKGDWEMVEYMIYDYGYFPELDDPELAYCIDYNMLAERLEDAGLKSTELIGGEKFYYWLMEDDNVATKKS